MALPSVDSTVPTLTPSKEGWTMQVLMVAEELNFEDSEALVLRFGFELPCCDSCVRLDFENGPKYLIRLRLQIFRQAAGATLTPVVFDTNDMVGQSRYTIFSV